MSGLAVANGGEFFSSCSNVKGRLRLWSAAQGCAIRPYTNDASSRHVRRMECFRYFTILYFSRSPASACSTQRRRAVHQHGGDGGENLFFALTSPICGRGRCTKPATMVSYMLTLLPDF